jgi:pyruvate,water dikinase
MVGGVDVIMYRPDEELKKLARHAIDLGVDTVLLSNATFDEAERHLSTNASGIRWLALLEESREPWFNISTGTGMYHHHKSWNDDLNVPFAAICDYINKLNSGETIDRSTGKVRQERDRTIAEYRALIGNDEDRAAFDQLLKTAHTVFPYVENHLFYVEHWFHSVFWNKVREFSRILVDHGMIREIEDVWYLKRGEIKDALWDLVTAWATGVKPRGRITLPKEIAWRKDVLQKFREWSPPPALGTLPEKIQEPFTIVLWGITNDSLNTWSEILDHGANNGSALKGFPGSPGSVTGKARVCMTVDDVINLEEGEILVAPTTSPSWAPSFSKIRACVTDVGGVMCHAAIVCREYGMPAVVGTGHGTKLITTGQQLHVDGVTGEVHLLQ